MSELRNEPSASAANSGTVIMTGPGRELTPHTRPRKFAGQGFRTTDDRGRTTDQMINLEMDGEGKEQRMTALSVLRRLSSVLCVLLAFPATASAVPCGSGNFEGWLEGFKRE